MIKKISIISLITLVLIFLLEFSARIYLKYRFDYSQIGINERIKHLKYQPFVMYGKNPHDYFKKIKKNFDINLFNVLVIGGSTAEGFPSRLLENSLTEITKKKIKVYNAGMGGYNSSQEIIFLVHSLVLDFDLIIFLNGANDILHSFRPGNKPGTFYLNSSFKFFLNNPYLSPLFDLTLHSQLIIGATRFIARQRNLNFKNYLEYCEVYLSNMNKISKILNNLKTKYIVVLQPHVAFKKNKNINEKNFSRYNYREKAVVEMYKYVEEKMIKNAEINNFFFFSSINIFNNTTMHIFSDDVHFASEDGYKILSAEIVRELKSHYF